MSDAKLHDIVYCISIYIPCTLYMHTWNDSTLHRHPNTQMYARDAVDIEHTYIRLSLEIHTEYLFVLSLFKLGRKNAKNWFLCLHSSGVKCKEKRQRRGQENEEKRNNRNNNNGYGRKKTTTLIKYSFLNSTVKLNGEL